MTMAEVVQLSMESWRRVKILGKSGVYKIEEPLPEGYVKISIIVHCSEIAEAV